MKADARAGAVSAPPPGLRRPSRRIGTVPQKESLNCNCNCRNRRHGTSPDTQAPSPEGSSAQHGTGQTYIEVSQLCPVRTRAVTDTNSFHVRARCCRTEEPCRKRNPNPALQATALIAFSCTEKIRNRLSSCWQQEVIGVPVTGPHRTCWGEHLLRRARWCLPVHMPSCGVSSAVALTPSSPVAARARAARRCAA